MILPQVQSLIDALKIAKSTSGSHAYTQMQALSMQLKGWLSALESEVIFLEAIKGWRSWERMSIFAQENIINRINELKETIAAIKGALGQ